MSQPDIRPTLKPASFDVLGVPIAAVNRLGFIEELRRWRRTVRDGGAYVNFRDVHGVVKEGDYPGLKEAHAGALMNAPDGKPLAWIGRIRGWSDVEQVCGPEMMIEVCRAGVKEGWTHVLYGSSPTVLARLVLELQKSMPSLIILDAISPPYGAISSPTIDGLVERIGNLRPDFVWVGLGTPKQETWMLRYSPTLPATICMGVGAAFDMHAKTIERSPAWMRQVGLEWLGRAIAEPDRLGRRYAAVVPKFLWRLLSTELGDAWDRAVAFTRPKRARR